MIKGRQFRPIPRLRGQGVLLMLLLLLISQAVQTALLLVSHQRTRQAAESAEAASVDALESVKQLRADQSADRYETARDLGSTRKGKP